MIRGMYTATSGMVANFTRQRLVANNLANVTTTGYKQDTTAPTDFTNFLMAQDPRATGSTMAQTALVGELGVGTELEEVKLDLSQGALEETGNALDLAITGPGFFAVQTPNGTLYTRDGTFFRDALGQVCREDGGLLLGVNGPIQVGEGEILVEGDGTVSVNGVVAERIRLVDFGPQERLLKLGGNYLAPENPNAATAEPQAAAINQGFLERSNVELTRVMTEMLSAMRSYEASQRMIMLQDQTLQRTVNDVAKV